MQNARELGILGLPATVAGGVGCPSYFKTNSGVRAVGETGQAADTFASRLSLALDALNLSRGQLAAAVGVDKSLVSRWLSGEVVPTAYNRARISDSLSRIKPGFNATLWQCPQDELRAFLGLPSPAAAIAAAQGAAESQSAASLWDFSGITAPFRSPWAAVLLVALVGGVFFIAWLLRSAPVETAPNKPAPRPALAAAFVPPASIAVLPFLNMSGDASKEYVSDGISEELLNDLSNVPDMLVAARTSSFAFKNKAQDIKQIGETLRVRTVLEGSIREEGQRLRITAQLIDASSGYHMWSQTYDRNFKDVLATQAEIARAITKVLAHRLMTAPPPPAIDPNVYRMFLQARELAHHRVYTDSQKAVALLQQVVKAEPAFPEAFALLGSCTIDLYDRLFDMYGWGNNTEPTLHDAAHEALTHALVLDPNNLTALIAGSRLSLADEDWTGAAGFIRRARALRPNSSEVLMAQGNYESELGFPQRAQQTFRRAAALDPLSTDVWMHLAEQSIYARDFNGLLIAGEKATSLSSANPGAVNFLCGGYALTKQLGRARAVRAQLLQIPEGHKLIGCQFDIVLMEGHLDDARAIADRCVTPLFTGANHLVLGDTDRAIAEFEKAYDTRDEQLFSIPYDKVYASAPGAAALFKSKRWLALTQRPRFRAWQSAHDQAARETL